MDRWKRIGAFTGVLTSFVLIAALLPLAERGAEGGNIATFSDALWYALVTLTTVGYGDYYPVTPLGQALGGVFILSSLGVLGLLIGQIGEAIAAHRERRRLGHHGFMGSEHIVVIGYNPLVEDVIEDLLASERHVVVVTRDKSEIDDIHEAFPQDEVFALYASYDDAKLMAHANLGGAFRVLLSLDEDTAALVTLLQLKRKYPRQTYVVSVGNAELIDVFYSAGAAHVISTGEVTAMLVASLIFEPDVAEYIRELITAGDGDAQSAGFDIQQYRIREGQRFDGATFGEAHRWLYENHRVVAVAMSRRSGASPELLNLPADDEPIRAGDYLLIVMREDLEPHFEGELFGVPHGVTS